MNLIPAYRGKVTGTRALASVVCALALLGGRPDGMPAQVSGLFMPADTAQVPRSRHRHRRPVSDGRSRSVRWAVPPAVSLAYLAVHTPPAARTPPASAMSAVGEGPSLHASVRLTRQAQLGEWGAPASSA